MKEKVLIIHNVAYHAEVTLAYYGILQSNNFDPWIYTTCNTYNFIELLEKCNLNYIKSNDKCKKDDFKKAFLITPTNALADTKLNFRHRSRSTPNYEDKIIQEFKSKMILCLHRPSKIQNLDIFNQDFDNPIFLGLSPMSQAFGLNFLFPMDNIIANLLPQKFILNKKVKFLLIGRWYDYNKDIRNVSNLIKLVNSKLDCSRDFQITIVGQNSNLIDSSLKDANFVEIKSDLTQIDFYNEINSCDYILNLGNYDISKYYSDILSSNYNHISSFRKPQICNQFTNLIFPTPSIIFSDENFLEIFEKAVNLPDNQYEKMVKDFDIPILNMRNHNSKILESII